MSFEINALDNREANLVIHYDETEEGIVEAGPWEVFFEINDMTAPSTLHWFSMPLQHWTGWESSFKFTEDCADDKLYELYARRAGQEEWTFIPHRWPQSNPRSGTLPGGIVTMAEWEFDGSVGDYGSVRIRGTTSGIPVFFRLVKR